MVKLEPVTLEPLHTPARPTDDSDAALRAQLLAEFVGQEAARDKMHCLA